MDNNLPPYVAILERMHREQNNAKELTMVPDKIRDQYQDLLDAQSHDIALLKDGMLKICQLLEANQRAPFVATAVAAPSVQESVPVVSAPVSIPKVEKHAVVASATGKQVPPEVYYPFAIEQLKKQNKPFGKNNTVSKGVHAVYGGLNAAIRKQYGEDTDVIALTDKMAEKGIIAMKMVRGGPMVYLPQDFTINDDSSTIQL